MPGLLFPSSSDQTGLYPGLTCSRIETPLPGTSGPRSWSTFWKLARLIENFPF
jgi:hypothetical protein